MGKERCDRSANIITSHGEGSGEQTIGYETNDARYKDKPSLCETGRKDSSEKGTKPWRL